MDKYMKLSFSRQWISDNEGQCSQKDGKQMRWTLWRPQFIAWREVPGLAARKGKELRWIPMVFLSWGDKEVGTGKSNSQGPRVFMEGNPWEERILGFYRGHLLHIQLSNDRHLFIRKLSKAGKRTIQEEERVQSIRSQTGPGRFHALTSKSRKCNSQGIKQGTQKGFTSLVEKN